MSTHYPHGPRLPLSQLRLLPLVAGTTWIITLLTLLIYWLAEGRPRYPGQSNPYVAFVFLLHSSPSLSPVPPKPLTNRLTGIQLHLRHRRLPPPTPFHRRRNPNIHHPPRYGNRYTLSLPLWRSDLHPQKPLPCPPPPTQIQKSLLDLSDSVCAGSVSMPNHPDGV